ncbi:hypothetical protein [Christiangramia forsetii]|uniref:Uncharacterized protein n=2 Tax=Christiangramia forsetii TaxID=411153 RepID=A0ABQ1WB04_9FLAO|nr:hypothetical protein [Christiangramia forsetii]GGG24025.1 hypothetical protein GCM10011532_04060 [Christiangramia forsetii]
MSTTEIANQTQKLQKEQWEVKQLKTLGLSKEIISGETSLANLEMNLSIQETFSKPTLRSVFKNETGSIGFSVVNVLVTRFVDSFGFSNKLSEVQIEMITIDALENCAYESLEDVILFFKMARSGKFGTTKRGVDSNLIFGEWFPMYLEQKAILREQGYEKEKGERNSNPDAKNAVAITKNRIYEAKKKEKVNKYINNLTAKMDKQALEDTISSWEKDSEMKPYVQLLKKKRRSVK